MRIFSTLMLLFGLVVSHAQINRATYTLKVTTNIDFSANPNIPKNVANRIKKRLSEPETYQLYFDQTQSIYKKEEKLDAPQTAGRGRMSFRFGSGTGAIVHTFLASRKQTSQQELFSKLFLVNRSPKKPKWVFSGETKQIGKYTAYEATYTEMQIPAQMRMSFGQRNTTEEEDKEPEKVPVTVSVWFTPEIPSSAGPAKYFGLPGLVLMVQDGNRALVCTEVQMNVSEKISLDPPKKGKQVTGAEFNKIRKEKAKEMRERFQNNSNRGNQNRIMIRG